MSRFERKAEANSNLLKTDITIRIAEARNAAKQLYGSMHTNPENLGAVFANFITEFFSLYDSTREQVDLNKLETPEAFDSVENAEKAIEQFLEQPFTPEETEDGDVTINFQKSAQRGMNLYRMYNKWLREAGMLDLSRYDHKEEGVGGKEVSDRRRNR